MLLFSKFKISGHSMEPFLKDGETVFVSIIPYLFKESKINDIVVFKFSKKFLIKRIEKIENYKYFVRGDNEKDSLDSRKIGFLKKNQILGKVIYKL